MKAQIAEGVYGPGAPLPSTRALAVELGVSRTTVTAAYEQLLAEGYLESRQGAKTRVASGFSSRSDVPKPTLARKGTTAMLSGFGKRVAEFPPGTRTGVKLAADFHYGDLSAADFPVLAWKRTLNRELLRRQHRLGYSDPCGLSKLRKALQGYLWRARGVRANYEQIIVVNGSQQALDLCARIILDPGDRVVIENPAYLQARQVFEAIGGVLQPIPVDGEGMQTQLLTKSTNARLAYVTPSHQYPIGSIMSVSRRQQLLAWAQRVGAYIIEDDYDAEYRFDTHPVEPLQSLDRAEVVIYVGTISKILSPQLRLGYLVLPHALTAAFASAKRLADRHTPTLEQAALAQFLETGAYESHVRRVRRRNSERRAVLLAALSTQLGDGVTVGGADAGLHVVVWLNRLPWKRETELIEMARAAGVGVYPISPLYHSVADRPKNVGLILGYAALDVYQIKKGVRRLNDALSGFGLQART